MLTIETRCSGVIRLRVAPSPTDAHRVAACACTVCWCSCSSGGRRLCCCSRASGASSSRERRAVSSAARVLTAALPARCVLLGRCSAHCSVLRVAARCAEGAHSCSRRKCVGCVHGIAQGMKRAGERHAMRSNAWCAMCGECRLAAGAAAAACARCMRRSNAHTNTHAHTSSSHTS